MHDDFSGQAPVILVRTGNDELTAIRTAPGSGWMPLGQQVVDSVRGLLGDDSGQAHGRCFQLPVDELDKWDTLQHYDRGDGFSYAVGWGDSGKFEKMFSIKEVSSQTASAPLDPIAVMNAVALAQVKASIDHLTEAVEAIGLDVRETLTFLQNQQQSALLAAVAIIDDVHRSLDREGSLGRTDWERINKFEHLLQDQHRQVLLELTKVADTLEYRNIAEAKSSRRVSVERVHQVITLEYYLLRSLHRWTELMITWKTQAGETTAEGVRASRDMVTACTAEARDIIERIRQANTSATGRSPWMRLATNGFLGGAFNDRRIRDAADRNRAAIQHAADVDLTPALPAPPTRLQLCAAAPGDSTAETFSFQEVV